MTVLGHLKDAGVTVDNASTEPRRNDGRPAAVLELEIDKRHLRFLVEQRGRAPYPGEIVTLTTLHDELKISGVPLLIAPFIGDEVGRQLVSAGWSWADAEGNYDIRAEGIRLRQRLASRRSPSARRSLPRGRGSWAFIRWLIANGEVTGLADLTLDAEVSQPRVSQIGGQLEELGLLHRARGSWRPEREELLDRFLREYPGPGGSEICFYSLDDALEVTSRVQGRDASTAISGDVAADLLAPWRSPTMLVIYTQAPISLDMTPGVVKAHSRGDANILHRVPDDFSVFLSARRRREMPDVNVPIADPVQVLWDLEDLGGDDRLQAAEKLRRWLLTSR
jgi:hypothetical protein